MIARPGGTSWAVRLSVARRGGWRAWLAVSGEFERDLAGQESNSVLTPHVEAESRRGRDYVRVTIVMTVPRAGHRAGADCGVVDVPQGGRQRHRGLGYGRRLG
ncbi:MAG: hypothetical protein ACRDPY_34185 [Streptosporangiaceae bacterium]